MDEKTNVMRILDQKKVKYTEYTYLNTVFSWFMTFPLIVKSA